MASWGGDELPEVSSTEPQSTRQGEILPKAADEEGIELLRQMAEVVFNRSETPADWDESFILNLYKGKDETLDDGNYHSLKLSDQVLKLLTWVLDFYIHQSVYTDNI